MLARRYLLLSVLILVAVALSGWTPAAATPLPEVIALPDGFQPEGITIGNGQTAYAGSLANGDIYAANLQSGAGEIVIAGPGTPAVGLDFDRRSGYLYVAGGPTGDGRIYDTATGVLVASFDFGGGFVNDVSVARDAAYFTDSFAPFLYKVLLGPAGQPTGAAAIIELSGDFVFEPGAFNANGVVATRNGQRLIIVHSSRGELYDVNPQSGVATLIDLGGASAANGDGLVLVGRRLYVVQNFQNKIGEFVIAPGGLSATLVDTITSPHFDIPTTADDRGAWLYVVNARFTTPPGPTVTYDIVRVAR